jgi:hypothetical protein
MGSPNYVQTVGQGATRPSQRFKQATKQKGVEWNGGRLLASIVGDGCG